MVSAEVEAWSAVCDPAFDLILLNVRIPAPDGVQVMRGRRFDIKVPVLAVTAYPDMETADAGLDVLMIKPVEPQALLAQGAGDAEGARLLLERSPPKAPGPTPLVRGLLSVQPVPPARFAR